MMKTQLNNGSDTILKILALALGIEIKNIKNFRNNNGTYGVRTNDGQFHIINRDDYVNARNEICGNEVA